MFSIRQVPRSENKKVDTLSKIASTSFAHLSKQVLVKELKEKSLNELEILAVVEEEGTTWMTPIYEYLTEETLPVDVNKARAVHRPILRNLQQKLTPITSLWPFYKWGIDISGPFLEGPGKVKFLIVAIDYFTKLDARSKNWMEEISHVLWAYRTMIKSSNGDTPFSLTYGTEEVIPVEIGMPTLRIAEVDMVQNNEALEINLDHLEERREQAAIREAKSKAKMEKKLQLKGSQHKLQDRRPRVP
ncbi:reverse transcriptase domain-containing protein [Tanacetum coccineum]